MNHVDELISASLSGDLTDTERHQLETHLDSCPRCRATLAAFTDQRRLISGLRHAPAPRDLGARVRSGIETGRRIDVPWWRRPTSILAAVGGVGAIAAGAVLAIILFNPGPIQVATTSATPSPSASAGQSVAPTPSETPAPSPSATPVPSASVAPAPAEPAGHFVYQRANQSGSVHYVTPTKEIALDLPSLGMPARAALSPDGAWLAFRIDGDTSGLSDYYALRLSDEKLVALGRSLQPAYGLGEQLAWSPDSAFLSYTLTSQDSKTDAWAFSTAAVSVEQLTSSGDAFASSWAADDRHVLWVSRAAMQPTSYLVQVEGAGINPPFDPSSAAIETQPGVFEPLVAPDGKHVIFWRGTMGTPGGHWSFSEGA
jgi:hypothetical protein